MNRFFPALLASCLLAVSTDLVNWKHLPQAIEPDELGAIFSGNPVVTSDEYYVNMTFFSKI